MAVLTQEQYLTLRTKLIEFVDQILVAREIISPLRVDEGTQTYGYDKLSTDMTAAEIISKYAPGSRDIINLDRKSKDVAILHKGFQVSRIDYKSSLKAGVPIKTIGLNRATRKVAELEDSIIFLGDATRNLDGVNTVAGNTVTGGLNWGTGTATDSLNPYTDILNMQTALAEDGFDLKWISLNPTNYGEAAKKIPASDGTWMEMIKDIVPSVLKSKTVTEGTILGGDKGQDVAELVIAEDFELLDPNNDQQLVYIFDILHRIVPMFYEYGAVASKSDAFVKATGI
uniref:Putative encapsulating protein for peroxidase n=1 Tax=viral metagenome TaxID=1070528 RepID=A0A6M3M408_9ZZZZ